MGTVTDHSSDLLGGDNSSAAHANGHVVNDDFAIVAEYNMYF